MTPDEARSLLGVAESAKADEIKQAVRKLSVRYHPDRHVGASDELVQLAQREFSHVQEAGRLLIRLLEGSPDTKPAAEVVELEHAIALLDQGDATAAYEVSGRILSTQPNHEGALTVRVRAAWAVKDLETALVCSRRLVEINPAEWWNWYAVGESAYKREHDSESIASFQRALELAPADPDVRTSILSELFHVQLFSGDRDGAASTLASITLISGDPNRLEPLRELLRDSQQERVVFDDGAVQRGTAPEWEATAKLVGTTNASIMDEGMLDPSSFTHANPAMEQAIQRQVTTINGLRRAGQHQAANEMLAELNESISPTDRDRLIGWLQSFPASDKAAHTLRKALTGEDPAAMKRRWFGLRPSRAQAAAKELANRQRLAELAGQPMLAALLNMMPENGDDSSLWAVPLAAVGAVVIGLGAGLQTIVPLPWYAAFVLALVAFAVGYKFWKTAINAGF